MTRPLLWLLLLLPGLAFAQQPTFREAAEQAAAARDANNVPRALELYREAVNLNPTWDEGWWFLGSLSYDADQFAAARDALSQFVRLDSDAAPGFALLGLSQYELNDSTQALANIERGLSLGVHNPQMESVLRYHEAQLLTQTGDFDNALRKYAALIQSGVSDPQLPVAMGLAALRRPLLPRDVRAEDVDLFTAAGKAAMYTLAGDAQNAQLYFKELLDRYPNALNVHYVFGCSLLAKNPDLAMEQLREETRQHPDNGAAAAMLAWMSLVTNDVQTACPYAKVAIANAPKLPLSEYVIGRCLVAANQEDQAIPYLQSALAAEPSNLDDHMALAMAYSKAGRKADAQREREASLALRKEMHPVVP